MFVEKDNEELLLLSEAQNRFREFEFHLTEAGLGLARVGPVHAGRCVDNEHHSSPRGAQTEKARLTRSASPTGAAGSIAISRGALLADCRADDIGQTAARTRVA